MTPLMLQHIPLASAYLCQDCDAIGNSATRCPACASTALLGLSCILNRTDGVERENLDESLNMDFAEESLSELDRDPEPAMAA